MAVALTRYFENLRYLFTLYDKYSTQPDAEFKNKDKINYVEKYFNDNKRNNQINLLNMK